MQSNSHINLEATTTNQATFGEVFNTAVGDRANLLEMTQLLKTYLSIFDQKISNVPVIHGPERKGDIPHSLASVDKAKELLGYEPSHNLELGLKEAVEWYWGYLI